MIATMRRIAPVAALVAVAPVAHAQAPAAPDAGSTASRTQIDAAVAEMAAAMKPGQGFAYRPLVQADGSVAALEYWKAPGRPAVHPDEAEYAVVIAGAGTLVSGGTLEEAVVVNGGLTEGSRIRNGTTRPLRPGDVLMIPAGMPHWFGIDGGKLVLLGLKLRGPAPGAGAETAAKP